MIWRLVLRRRWGLLKRDLDHSMVTQCLLYLPQGDLLIFEDTIASVVSKAQHQECPKVAATALAKRQRKLAARSYEWIARISARSTGGRAQRRYRQVFQEREADTNPERRERSRKMHRPPPK